MNCKLNKKINHQDVKAKFKEATVPCLIFARKELGMSVLGTVCANCCIRTYQVLEKRAELLRERKTSPEDIKLEPNCFVRWLQEPLKTHGEVVPKESHLNWTEINSECARCKGNQAEPIIAKVTEATEMRYVGRNDLRTRL
jgi:hypothetical protein